VQLQLVDARLHRQLRAGKERGAHPVGDVAEAQIEARRLDLVRVERSWRADLRRIESGADLVVGEDSGSAFARQDTPSTSGCRHSRASGNPYSGRRSSSLRLDGSRVCASLRPG